MIPLRDWITGYRRAYLDELSEWIHRQKYGVIDRLRPLPLDKVDVTLRRYQAPQVLQTAGLTPSTARAGQSIWDFLRDQASWPQHFVVIGGPGSGKTTLILAMMHQMQHGTWAQRRLLPITLLLQNAPFLEYINDHPKCSIPELLRNLNMVKTDRLAHWSAHQLRKGRGVVLLDGLDEVHHESLITVRNWIDHVLQHHGNNRVIITSRPGGYERTMRDRPLNAQPLRIELFEPEEICAFLDGWYATHAPVQRAQWHLLRRIPRRGERPLPTHPYAQDLYQRLSRSTNLFSFAREPLLLTLLVNLDKQGIFWFKRRRELYAEACQLLLDDHKSGDAVMSAISLQDVLAFLAYKMSVLNQTIIRLEEGIDILAPLARNGTLPLGADAFFTMFERDPGLLVEVERERYRFVHRSFQEYLTATYLERHSPIHELVSLVAQQEANRWDETLLWYAAHRDISDVLLDCLRSTTLAPRALVLAIASLTEDEEAANRHPRLHTRIEALVAPLSSGYTIQSATVVDIMLQGRLQRMVPISRWQSKDMTLITSVEYQRFLDDRVSPELARWPDQWEYTRFPPHQALQPVAGVSPEDADAFCQWLSRRDSAWTYRLPYEQEIPLLQRTVEGHVVMTPTVGYWFHLSNGAYSIREGRETLGLTRQHLDDYLGRDKEWITKGVQCLRDRGVMDHPLAMLADLVHAAVHRLVNDTATSPKVDSTRDEVNQQPFDVNIILQTAKQISSIVTKAEQRAIAAAARYGRAQKDSFTRSHSLVQSVHAKVHRAYVRRSEPSDALRLARESMREACAALYKAINRTKGAQRYETSEESAARKKLRRIEELKNSITKANGKIQQLENGYVQRIKTLREQIPPQPASNNRVWRWISTSQKRIVLMIERWLVRACYTCKIRMKQCKRARLQREESTLQPQIDHARKLCNQFDTRQKALQRKSSRLVCAVVWVAIARIFLWFIVPLFNVFFYLQGWCAEQHVRKTVQPPNHMSDRLMVWWSPLMIWGMAFWAKCYQGMIHIARIIVWFANLSPDIDQWSYWSLEKTRAHIRRSLEAIGELLREIQGARTDLCAANRALRTTREKAALAVQATDHARRITPFRQHAELLVKRCEDIVAQRTRSPARKTPLLEIRRQTRLYALVLAEADIKLFPAGSRSLPWESTKLRVGTAYALTPLCLWLYASLVVLEERVAGRLIPIEGIRLVREPR